jgi:hypothetical protein
MASGNGIAGVETKSPSNRFQQLATLHHVRWLETAGDSRPNRLDACPFGARTPRGSDRTQCARGSFAAPSREIKTDTRPLTPCLRGRVRSCPIKRLARRNCRSVTSSDASAGREEHRRRGGESKPPDRCATWLNSSWRRGRSDGTKPCGPPNVCSTAREKCGRPGRSVRRRKAGLILFSSRCELPPTITGDLSSPVSEPSLPGCAYLIPACKIAP